ncbi:hypothetical protein [Anaerotruncus colihominis]|uniref:hypothetical protein n=1 Tax=Anaerotruncus colihominis TaxID=169435 RepID=UPI0026F21D73|nr:hypothetical protein [Anaerotruncus colihominis]
MVRQGISDGEAKLIITHSNRQRGLDELLPSEKTFAFKMELEGLKETRKQLQKVDLITQLESAVNADEQSVSEDLFKVEQMKYSRETLAEHYGLNPTEWHRLIHLPHLCPELLELVNDAKLPRLCSCPHRLPASRYPAAPVQNAKENGGQDKVWRFEEIFSKGGIGKGDRKHHRRRAGTLFFQPAGTELISIPHRISKIKSACPSGQALFFAQNAMKEAVNMKEKIPGWPPAAPA